MWEHSRRSCPLCRHDIHDCLPARRITVRRVAELTELTDDGDATTDEAFEQLIRRINVTSVMENALRAQPPIAPRNALFRRRASSLRVVAIPSAGEVAIVPHQSEQQQGAMNEGQA